MSERGGQGGFYYGSRLLNPLTELSGLPIDQINFLVCQLVALAIGFPFRLLLSPRTTSPQVRHVVEVLVGVALILFCFGSQIWHLMAHATLGYILIQFYERSWAPKVTFIVALGYLAVLHIYRQTYDYGGYTLDITGPIMISVQKITGVMYSLQDGRREEKDLSDFQKKQAIKNLPTVLSFYSYIFCFHDVMCGPLVFYNDYIAFIDGSCYTTQKQGETRDNIPSPMGSVLKKICMSVVLGALMLLEPFVAPWDRLFDNDFLYNTNYFYRQLYVLTSMTMHRPRYYFAWKLGELVNNNNGLGFNGYDKDGNAKWDLLNNVQIYDLEMATSLKVNIESWNTLTAKWLRHTVYDRAPLWIRTWAVFTISAFWHGFYPGYYILFLTGALATEAARLVRRNVRPYFQQSEKHRLFYDAVTFIFVRFGNCYLVAPFVILEVVPSLKILWTYRPGVNSVDPDEMLRNAASHQGLRCLPFFQLFKAACCLMRRNVRPYFLQSEKHKLFYDAVTFTFVRFANCYLVCTHVMLEFIPSLKLLLSLYLWLHIGAIGVIVYFKLIQPILRPKKEKAN